MMRPAVFLDKDGTLVDDVPYNVDPDKIVLAPGAADAVRLLHERGFALIVVSNQGGVALGHFEEAALDGVREQLTTLVARCGAALQAVYFCPHHPDGVVARYTRLCTCRKPSPGLILRAAEEHGIDLARSWMVGDILDDVEAGRRAGCRTVLVDNGNETVWRDGALRRPHAVAANLRDAADAILAGCRPRQERAA